jgi:hypothetical protein
VADLYKALEQIHAIRGQVARGTEFRGYGPETVAATGLLAGAAALLQSVFLKDPGASPARYLAIWISTAALALLLTGVQTVTRTRRVHPGLARQMMLSAGESFVPAIVAGGLVTLVLLRSAPHESWMLPGLWQIFYGLGILASCRFLPRQMFAVGAWFLATGALCLTTGNGMHALSAWEMGFPFGIGQLLIAAVLKFGYRGTEYDA